MKIYFAGSIRGDREDQQIYLTMIEELRKYGTVLTEHVGDQALTSWGENGPAKEIFERDVEWLSEADLVVAEVTIPSIGVGYELGRAQAMGKPVICFYREQEGKRLSAMISGNEYFNLHLYHELKDIGQILERCFESTKAVSFNKNTGYN